MKTNLIKLMSAAMAVLAVTMVFTSCCNDSDSEPIKFTTSLSDGSFEVTNLSAHEPVGSSAVVIYHDTLLIKFNSKQDYENPSFTISCRELEKVNDSIFVVPSLKTGENKITLEAADTVNNYIIYKAEQIITFKIPESYMIIPLSVRVSADLKPFIDVELSYTDKEGKEKKYLIKEEEWIKPDSALFYKYETEDGLIGYASQVPEGAKILEEEKLASDPRFTLDTRFVDLKNDVTTTFSARYIPKQNVELEREEYRFTHYIDRKSAQISIPGKIVIDAYTSINIDLTDHTVRKEDVASYLEELSAKPDIKKFKLLTSGSIESVK